MTHTTARLPMQEGGPFALRENGALAYGSLNMTGTV